MRARIDPRLHEKFALSEIEACVAALSNRTCRWDIINRRFGPNNRRVEGGGRQTHEQAYDKK